MAAPRRSGPREVPYLFWEPHFQPGLVCVLLGPAGFDMQKLAEAYAQETGRRLDEPGKDGRDPVAEHDELAPLELGIGIDGINRGQMLEVHQHRFVKWLVDTRGFRPAGAVELVLPEYAPSRQAR